MRKGAAGRSSKDFGLREASLLNQDSISKLGPLENNPSHCDPFAVGVGQSSFSEPGPSSQTIKRTPSSIRGKKSLARGIRPKPDLNTSVTHQWKLSSAVLTTISAANTSPSSSDLIRPPEEKFEFAALEKNGSGQVEESSAVQFSGDRQADLTRCVGQQLFNRVGSGAEATGSLSNLGSSESSEYEDVGDVRMASEEGDGAPSTA